MTETTTEKATCGECGSDIRENTQFCYNCGNVLADDKTSSNGEADVDVETQAALVDLSEKLKADERSSEKMSKAAAERKKSRSGQRRSKKIVWEPKEDVSSSLILLVSIIVAVVAAIVVFVTVTWK